jgi:hypothetical protein
MAIFDDIFGGSSSKTTTNPRDVTPPELQALRSPFAVAANRLLGNTTGGGLSGIPAPSGPMSAPITAGEQAQLGALSADDPLQQARRSYLTQVMEGKFLPGQPGSNPFLQASIDAASRPILQGLQDLLSRELPGRFTQAGQFVNPRGSSPFDFAAARATGETANALGDIGTRLAFETQEAERQRQQEGVQLGQQEVQSLVTNLQAQALPRLIEDLGIERGQEIFKTRLQALLQALGVITQAPLQTIGTASQSKSSESKGIIPSLFQ